MKRLFHFAAFLAVCGMIACQCDTQDNTPVVPEPDPTPVTPDDPPTPPEPPTPEPVKPAPGTYTFVLPDFAAKPAWEAGDQITVRGNYAPGVIYITLEADNISEDGKMATVDLATIPSTFCLPDYLYAAYPADQVQLEDVFCDPVVNFNSGYPIMVAYWKEGNVFEFKPGCAAITCTVDGTGYDAIVLGGAAREDILFDRISVTWTSEESLFTRNPSDGHPFLVQEIPADGKVAFCFPSRTQFNKGFSIYLKKGDSYPLVYTHTSSTTFKVGQVLELGDIMGSMQPYDGPVPEEMPMPEVLSKTTYKVNVEELSGICLTEDGKSLWGVGDQGQLAIITITEDNQVQIQNIKHFSNDLEAITRDPATNTLYIGTEPNSVYRCETPFTSYTRIFKVTEAANYGNSGIEGIAWYKDNSLYVGTQVGANLWRYDLSGNILDFISLKDVRSSIKEIGGLCYDPVCDWLWVTDSESHALFVFTGDARMYLGKYKLSSDLNNESVCVDHARGGVWVGDDNDDQPRLIWLEMPGINDPKYVAQ